MRIYFIILFICFYIQAEAQIVEPVHLSYNLNGLDCGKKIIDGKEIHFYIKGQHFKSIQSLSEVSIKEINKLNIISIDEFLNLALEERKQRIRQEEGDNKVKILFNDQIFKKIYLYTKGKNNKVNKYIVTWVEEIE